MMKVENLRLMTGVALLALFSVGHSPSAAQGVSSAWNPDRGTHYVNPVINADYSDPDVCRVGDDYYMTSSSFCCFPGLQILHSTDLVNWEIIGAALRDYPGDSWSDSRPWEALGHGMRADLSAVPDALEWKTVPQHGNGVWAPAIRYHAGEFYIYCGDPDRGIFMVKTSDPSGIWEDPVWVVKAKGFIDPCPLWDDDGKAWLSFGCAGSRAGNKSVMFVAPMSLDGTSLLSSGRIVYDGHRTQPTIEGTKFYKFRGHYYIFSPAGGVPTGWQVVLRAEHPYGPYSERVVMAQGASSVNGPHQGAWVDTPSGEHWFLHFQDKDAYGRVVHLQPMAWTDEDWPVIGTDKDGDGVGEPVMKFRKPSLKGSGTVQPAESDDFLSVDLGRQWQWNGVPSPYWCFVGPGAAAGCDGESAEADCGGNAGCKGALKLYSVEQAESWRNLSDSPNLLLQKFPADKFTVTAKVRFVPNPQLKEKGENGGLTVFGLDYFALRLVDTKDGVVLQAVECRDALQGSGESVLAAVPLISDPLPLPYSDKYMSSTVPPVPPLAYSETCLWLRVSVSPKERKGDVPAAVCRFLYSLDGRKWLPLPDDSYRFTARPGKWTGAKFGFFCNRHASKNDSGWLQIDCVTVD
ncbi:MAG: glycoside hydrolase 43 family protein [Candidatus Cryptobacteroides sp.]